MKNENKDLTTHWTSTLRKMKLVSQNKTGQIGAKYDQLLARIYMFDVPKKGTISMNPETLWLFSIKNTNYHGYAIYPDPSLSA